MSFLRLQRVSSGLILLRDIFLFNSFHFEYMFFFKIYIFILLIPSVTLLDFAFWLSVLSSSYFCSVNISGGQRQPSLTERALTWIASVLYSVPSSHSFSYFLRCPLYPKHFVIFFHIPFALTSLTHFYVPIKCQLNLSEPFCLPLRPTDSGAGLHGDASGTGEACGDDLQSAASTSFPCASLRVASIKPAASRRSLRRPKRRDGVHHPQPESRRVGGVHL